MEKSKRYQDGYLDVAQEDEEDEIVANVHVSKDHEKFSLSLWNREKNIPHLNRLIESMKVHRYDSGYPILVNERNEILDGHHRYMAAKALNIPYAYMRVGNPEIDSVVLKGRAMAQWKTKDFLYYWGNNAEDKEDFKFFFDLKNTYNLSDAEAIVLCTETSGGGQISDIIKRGTFEVKNKKETERIAKIYVGFIDFLISEGIKHINKYKTRCAVRAFLKLLDCPAFDLESFKRNIQTYSNQFKLGTSVETWSENFLITYNFKRKNKLVFEGRGTWLKIVKEKN